MTHKLRWADISMFWSKHLHLIFAVIHTNIASFFWLDKSWLVIWSDCFCDHTKKPMVAYLEVKLPRYSHIDSLVKDCNISNELAMEILQSCTKPSIYSLCPFSFLIISIYHWPSLYSNTDKYIFPNDVQRSDNSISPNSAFAWSK